MPGAELLGGHGAPPAQARHLGAPHPITWARVGAQRVLGGWPRGRAQPGALGGKESLGIKGETLTPELAPPNLSPCQRSRQPQPLGCPKSCQTPQIPLGPQIPWYSQPPQASPSLLAPLRYP